MDAPNDRKERLLEAAMALLQASPGQELNITLLNKALFYLDLLALRDTGDTVTHATYVALDLGPVVAKYQDRLVKALEKAGLAVQEKQGMGKPVRAIDRVESFQHLDSHALELVAEVAKGLSGVTSTSISKYSHDNPGWLVAYESGLKHGRPAQKIDMMLALQQLAEWEDADPWLDEEADAPLLSTFAAVKAATGR